MGYQHMLLTIPPAFVNNVDRCDKCKNKMLNTMVLG